MININLNVFKKIISISVFFSVLLISGKSFSEFQPIDPPPDDCDISYDGPCIVYGYYETVEAMDAAAEDIEAQSTSRLMWSCTGGGSAYECKRYSYNAFWGWLYEDDCRWLELIPQDQYQCFCDSSGPDIDDDGFSGDCDLCPDNGQLQYPDADCGCELTENLFDSDDDGTYDCKDGCPNDVNKIAPGDCGCGKSELECMDDGENGGDENGNEADGSGESNTNNNEESQTDPINIINGNIYISKKDIEFPSPFNGGLIFKRSYNSRSYIIGAMGYGWSHSYNLNLTPNYVYSTGTEDLSMIKIKDPTGRGYYFSKTSDTLYAQYPNPNSTVEVINSTYVWATPQGKAYTFNETGRLIYITDVNGNTQTMIYDGQNRLESVTDSSSGRSLTFVYNTNGYIESIQGPVTDAVGDGIWVIYGYDTKGNLVSATYADGSGYTFEYSDPNDPHNVTAQYDTAGHFLNSWAYDDSDRAYVNINRSGLGGTIDYSDTDNIKVTDVYGVTRIFTLQSIGEKRVISNIQCDTGQSVGREGVIRYGFDENGNIIEKEFESGRIDKFQNIDNRGNPGIITKASGTPNERTIYFTWHPTLNKKLSRSETSILGEGDKITIWDYDDDYDNIPNESPTKRISRYIEKGATVDQNGVIVPYEYITVYNYNTRGQITLIDGPVEGNQDTIDCEYDPATGDLISTTNLITGTTTYSHDIAGNILTNTDINGIVSTYTYDGKNRPLTIIRNGATTSLTYYNSVKTELKTITDAQQRLTSYEYDKGKLAKVTDQLGGYRQFLYDDQANLTEESIVSYGQIHKINHYDYKGDDLPGELWKKINFDDSYTEYRYDQAGNISSIVYPDNKIVSYEYDLFNRLTSTTQPGQVMVFYSYDRHGNPTTVTDAIGNITTFTYDDLGRRVKTESPDTGTTRYSFTALGKIATKTINSGLSTAFTYDAIGRITGINYADPSENVIFTYDEGENGMGRLTGKTGQDYSVTYTYNAEGQIITASHTIDSISFSASYTYDNTGILTGVTYPDGRTVTYGLDAIGRQESIDTSNPQGSTIIAEDCYFKPFGPLTSMFLGNGISIDRTYDQGYNLTGISAGSYLHPIQNLSYEHSLSGAITSITDNMNSSRNQSFTYDALNRLTTATGKYGTLAYTYDDAGNRSSKTENNVTETYNYLPQSNIIESVTNDLNKSFLHDTNGNILTATEETYDTVPSTQSTYLYNSDGQRIRKISDGQTIYYLYDLNGHLLAEMDNSGNVIQSYFYINGMRIGTIDLNGSLYYYINNHLEAPEMMINQDSLIVWKADYKPFGEASIDPTSMLTNNFRFPGQMVDPETGYYYNWNRYYDPSTGRYLTPDPIGLAGGINLYAYVLNDPVNWIDPMGLAYNSYNWGDYYQDAVMGDTDNPAEFAEYQAVDHQVATEAVGDIVMTGAAADLALGGVLLTPLVVEAAPVVYTSAMATAGTPVNTIVGQTTLANLANAALWDKYGTGQPGYFQLMENIWNLLNDYLNQDKKSSSE